MSGSEQSSQEGFDFESAISSGVLVKALVMVHSCQWYIV